jgi:hypothetical protein
MEVSVQNCTEFAIIKIEGKYRGVYHRYDKVNVQIAVWFWFAIGP